LLNDLILGTPVAPLYKKLRESGLGESVIAGGLSTTPQHVTFTIGMYQRDSRVKSVNRHPIVTVDTLRARSCVCVKVCQGV